ncbi:MAG TPA: hypothetical protein VHV82_08200 [Sporichthyaceae bacterium]|nr:hypothetical protein [Sporichthyaceae bacterium]
MTDQAHVFSVIEDFDLASDLMDFAVSDWSIGGQGEGPEGQPLPDTRQDLEPLLARFAADWYAQENYGVCCLTHLNLPDKIRMLLMDAFLFLAQIVLDEVEDGEWRDPYSPPMTA